MKLLPALLGLLLTFNLHAENSTFASDVPVVFRENNIPDSITFPDQFNIALVSVLEHKGSPHKYYLIGVERSSLYAMNYADFYEQFDSGVQKKDLKRIAIKNIKYVKVLDIFTISQEKIEDNVYYQKKVGNRFLKNVFTGFSAGALYGFSMDIWLSSIWQFAGTTFPIITLSAAVIGLAYTSLGALLKVLLDYSGKFGEFKNDHMVKREGFSFKYDFKYGKISFNRRAMQALSFQALNR